ncbi:MAG TPA: hypothetical protein VIW70_12985 [Rubrivivax sp.]
MHPNPLPSAASAPTPERHLSRREAALALTLAPCLPLWPAAAQAQAAAPKVPVVLTVSGKVKSPPGRVDFDMAALAAMSQHHHTTATPWYREARKFSGPLLRDVLAAAGAQGQTLRAIALNDYRVDIPVADVQRFGVILARLLDDQPMPVRQKGPLFVMYPFADHAELRNAVYYSRCAWQLKAIEVV